MKLTLCFVVLTIVPNLDGVWSKKQLVLEMDIEQEIINLKQSMAHKDAEISALHTLVTDLQQQIGSAYTRWGRTTCPENGTDLVYSGYMAGTYHDGSKFGTGAGANYLCVSDQPTWDHYSVTSNNNIREACQI